MEQKVTTGGEKIIQCLEREGVEYIFGLSGGAAMPMFDALLDSKIELILTRHEQGATHMADGYARSTGRPGVALVTSGPGATNTVTGLLTALMDSSPLIVICGQTISPMLGKDAFQEADVTGITYPVVKHSYLIKDAADIPAHHAGGLPPRHQRSPRAGPHRRPQGHRAGALRCALHGRAGPAGLRRPAARRPREPSRRPPATWARPSAPSSTWGTVP